MGTAEAVGLDGGSGRLEPRVCSSSVGGPKCLEGEGWLDFSCVDRCRGVAADLLLVQPSKHCLDHNSGKETLHLAVLQCLASSAPVQLSPSSPPDPLFLRSAVQLGLDTRPH